MINYVIWYIGILKNDYYCSPNSTKIEDICIPTFLGQFCMHLIVKHDLHDHWFDCGENEVFVGFSL